MADRDDERRGRMRGWSIATGEPDRTVPTPLPPRGDTETSPMPVTARAGIVDLAPEAPTVGTNLLDLSPASIQFPDDTVPNPLTPADQTVRGPAILRVGALESPDGEQLTIADDADLTMDESPFAGVPEITERGAAVGAAVVEPGAFDVGPPTDLDPRALLGIPFENDPPRAEAPAPPPEPALPADAILEVEPLLKRQPTPARRALERKMTEQFRVHVGAPSSDALTMTIREALAAAALIAAVILATLASDDRAGSAVAIQPATPRDARPTAPQPRSWKDAYTPAATEVSWKPAVLPPPTVLEAQPASVYAEASAADEGPEAATGPEGPALVAPGPSRPAEGAPIEAEPAAPVVRAAQPMLTVMSSPSGARVEIGGKTVGKTPLVTPAPAGNEDLAVRVSLVNHRPWQGLAKPSPSGHYTVKVELRPR